MRPSACPLVALSLALLAACSRFTIEVEHDPAASLPSARTWAWLPVDAADPVDQRMPDRYFDRRLREAVDRNLRARGYEPAATGTPDLYLNYRLSTDSESRSVAMPTQYGVGWWWASRHDPRTTRYDRGTLLVDAVDARTRTMVWRGAASAPLLPHAPLEKSVARIDTAIDRMFAEFPARTGR